MVSVGHWQNTSVLAIHSPQAVSLVKGHRGRITQKATHHRVWGLKSYSVLVTQVYQRAKADDPYAEITLLEIERRLAKAQAVISRCHRQLDQQLQQQLPGIRIRLSASKQPLQIPLNFSTPHANFGARLIGDYDLILRKIKTCRALGLLNGQQGYRYLKQVRRVVRGVFSTPVQYKNMSVTRTDVLQQTAAGKAAMDKLGEVDQDILSRKRQAQYGPRHQ